MKNVTTSRRSFHIQSITLGALTFAAGKLPSQTTELQSKPREAMQVNPRLFSFVGGNSGAWRVTEVAAISGESLPTVEKLSIVAGTAKESSDAAWILCGATSNERYVERNEKDQLLLKQASLGRAEANCGAMISIRKNAKWWSLTQDERRAIFEEKSGHNKIGIDYLPAIARRLHHCRDLTTAEPFDFITWFEFAQKDTVAFDQLLTRLRATEEWSFVDREVDIRVVRENS